MKKTIILLLVLFAYSYFAKAQSQSKSYVEGGIILMPQYTTLLNTNDFAAGNDLNYATTFGYAGGLTGSYNFNKHIGVELNVIYSIQGQEYKGNLYDYRINGADTASYASIVAFQLRDSYNPSIGGFPDTNFTEKVSLTYLKIPVLFKLTSNSEKSFFFYMNAGPEFNILLTASQSLNGKTVNYTSLKPMIYNFTTKQLYESSGVDAVLNLGAGYNLTSNFVLTAQVNFDYGLTDAEDKNFEFYPPNGTGGISTTGERVYATNRSTTNNATVGLRLGLVYKFVDFNKVSSKLTP